jgi:transposase
MSAKRQGEEVGIWHRRVIGLDMHPDLFSAAALSGPDAQRADVHWVHDRMPTTQFESWLGRHVEPEDLIVIEASGNTFATVDRIRAAGRQAIVLESFRAGQVRKAYCTTDKVSAVKLARIYLSGLAHEVWTPDETSRARREVLFSHRRTVQDTTRGRNRIRSWLTEHGIRAPRGLRLTQPEGLRWALGCREWTPTQQMLIQQLFTDLWQAEARRKKLRTFMAEEVSTDPMILQLVRLLGIRHVTAYALAAIIGDINRFRTPKQLVAYVGLNPRVKLSGNGGSIGALAHNGRSDLRVLLIQAAHSILRYGNGPSHKWALALVCRKGRNLAACAVARKLLVACWYLMHGRFTSLQEISETIRIKIHKLASAIGSTRIRELGFKSLAQFETEKSELLLNTT